MSPKALGPGDLEIWRGGVTPWQCDEMGHMNVRFYLAIAAEGLVGLAAALGLARAFSPDAFSTLTVREHHIRFLKEARAGDGLIMTGGVLAVDGCDAVLLQLLFHISGEPAAAITTRVTHVTSGDLKPFPWNRATLRLAEELAAAAPDFALPRGLVVDSISTMACIDRADSLGLPVTASGAVGTHDCDVFGRMTPEQVMGRIYSSISHVFRKSSAAVLRAAPELEGRLGGAAVEYRCLYHAPARAGDRLQLRSGHAAVTPKTRTVVHWLLDPATGRPWASAQMVSLFFDLEARKALTMPDAAHSVMAMNRIEGLGL